MSEYLAFSKSGQWELHKATSNHIGDAQPPKNSFMPGNKPYKVFSGNSVNGDLHQDFGQKGSLHDNNQGEHPKAQQINFRHAGKPATPLDSAYEERNPGYGII